MPKKVYNNIEGHRLIDNKRVCEDVTKIGLPTITHPSTTISAAGMAVDVDMPTTTHLDAMEFSITHNNGVNCQYLSEPGKHTMELRMARQGYTVANGELGHEGMKVRVIGVTKETQKGDIETGSPYGSTVKYSLLRYEEEIDGKEVALIDAMAGIIRFNGKDYMSPVENLLK